MKDVYRNNVNVIKYRKSMLFFLHFVQHAIRIDHQSAAVWKHLIVHYGKNSIITSLSSTGRCNESTDLFPRYCDPSRELIPPFCNRDRASTRIAFWQFNGRRYIFRIYYFWWSLIVGLEALQKIFLCKSVRMWLYLTWIQFWVCTRSMIRLNSARSLILLIFVAVCVVIPIKCLSEVNLYRFWTKHESVKHQCWL